MKILRIIFINLILFVLIFFIIEILCYKVMLHRYPVSNSRFWRYNDSFYQGRDIESRYNPLHNNAFKKFDVCPKQNKNKSIVVFGCSMAYGVGIRDNQTVSYKLSEKIGSTVYNMAIPAGGLNQILYILQKTNIKEYLKKEPEYFIYFYNPDHIRRIFVRCTPTAIEPQFVVYKKEKDKLIYKEHFFRENVWLYSFFNDEISNLWGNDFLEFITNVQKDYFFCYLDAINAQIKKLYPNSKFVIAKFSNDKIDIDLIGQYNIIDIPKLTGVDVMLNTPENIKKYNADEQFHPNEYYWDLISPVLIDKLYKF
ncbi:TPA: hypothetical protein IAA87_00805 [Candidatus Avigastranaerophilus faecigallinarum]|nr:hypothetical protein [Candidatus Avigastranaerophilus faecigallinarum]